MDETKYLILIRGKDETSNVLSYTRHGTKVNVMFKSLKSFPYSRQNVVIEENPTVIDVIDQVIYYNNILLTGVNQILQFNGKVKIIFDKQKSEVYNSDAIRVDDNSLNHNVAQDILNYWKEIAPYTKSDDDEEAFLKREYDRLTCINLESVLGCYITKEPLQCLNHDTNDVIFPFSFNLSQKQALENALRANVSVIEGPPGTGKTQSILNIIANLAIMQGKSVAVVSGNNAAVQNVKDKLEKEQYGFLLAFLGNKKNREAFFEKLPLYDVTDWKSEIEESVLLEKISSLNGRINYLLNLNNEQAKVQQELAAYYMERQHFNRYYDNQDIEGIKRLLFYRKTPERVISFLSDHYFATEEHKSHKLTYRLKLLIKYGFTDFKKLKENEIAIILNLQKEYYNLKIAGLEQRKKALAQELANAEFEQLLAQHKEYSTSLFKQKLYGRYHDKKVEQFTGTSYKGHFDKFIERFPVVLSTTYSLRNCVPDNYLFDYLIVDESSQVDLLSGALALSCCKRAIIVGDTKQLPHIVDEKIKEKIQTANMENIYDYFQHNILSSMLALYPELPRVILKEHYRCHPKIIGFCNQKYYRGALIPFTREDTNDTPFIFYRTVKGNHMREVTKGESRGKYNQRELDVIEEILQNPHIVTKDITEIGFTTPYRNQADRAGKAYDNGMECDTVHKYQGREKKLMIMSTVLDNTFPGKKGLAFVDDPCKINVAVSRAQDQFVLVTDHSFFEKAGKEVSDLIRYIEYHTLDEHLIESEVVSVFDLLYKEYSCKLIAFKKRLPNISKYQSENIMWQLLDDIISEDQYNCFEFTMQVLLRNLLKNDDKLTPEEVRYVNHNASVDFVVYYRLNRKPVLIIEVDGFAFHENNPAQLERDTLKNSILDKHELRLLRLATNGSREEFKIKNEIEQVLNGILGV